MLDAPTSPEALDVDTFFKSPILTLSESLEDVDADHISNHDVLEAYAILSNRIKQTAHFLGEARKEYSALNFFSKHTGPVVQCLRRDIKRALIDPLPKPSTPHETIPQSIEFLTKEPSASTRKQITEHPAICYAALGIVSNIFKFSTLSSLFAGKFTFLSRLMICAF